MTALSMFLAIALAAQTPARPVTADDYVGRWNVIITDAADTFVSGGIRIDKTGAGLSGGSCGARELRSGEQRRGCRRGPPDRSGAVAGKQDLFEARLEGER